jgi:hypothetical protein
MNNLCEEKETVELEAFSGSCCIFCFLSRSIASFMSFFIVIFAENQGDV